MHQYKMHCACIPPRSQNTKLRTFGERCGEGGQTVQGLLGAVFVEHPVSRISFRGSTDTPKAYSMI